MSRRPRGPLRLATLITLLAAVTACGADDAPQAPAAGQATTTETAAVRVVTSIYPLTYAAQRIGGDRVEVVSLTPPGADPHDVELTPQDVVTVSEADLVIYASGLQPALDEAIDGQQVAHAVDVAEWADLTPAKVQVIGEQGQAKQDHGHEHEEHGQEHEEHGHAKATGDSAPDPHFWLDPLRYEKVARSMATELGRIAPTGRMAFDDNVNALSRELTTLDGDFAAGLQQCARQQIVTSHAAFGYLTKRYGLTQVAISGLTGGGEADPARMAQITDYVRAHSVSTIYTEPLADPALGQTVAAETGAEVAVLDPLESLTEASPGDNYLEIMRANLATLNKGQGCS